MMPYKYHCVVITLDDAQARRDVISARLKSLGIHYEFVPGVDGKKLDVQSHPGYTKWKRRIFFGRDLSNGELGCILAHRNACEHIVNSDYDIALVLEDDALLSDNLPAVIDGLLVIRDQWDLVRFLGREKNYKSSRKITHLSPSQSMLARQLGIPGGAYGYLLSSRAARRLVSMTRRNWLPIDTLHGATWLTRLRTFSVIPSPILPNDDIPSCIDEQDSHRRWNKSVTLSGFWRIAYPFTRGLLKMYFNVMTRWMQARTLIPDTLARRKSVTDKHLP